MNTRHRHHDSIPADPARRRFLAAGSLTVGFTLLPGATALAAQRSTEDAAPTAASATSTKLPGNLGSTPLLDAWIKIDEQGRITVCTGKAELGTGIRTAFIQIAAEELQVGPEDIHLVTADTGLTPNEGYTAGSHSTADSGTAILNAAAQVRQLLLQSAAGKLGVDVASLQAANGIINAPDGRKMDYGQAVSGLDLHRNAEPTSPLVDPARHRVIGQSMPRVDIPAKVTGGTSYVQDLRPLDMVHARAVRAPSYGARLVSVDSAAIEKMPGVIKVVRDGSYLAVVAHDEWQAIQAMRALAVAAKWEESAVLPAPDALYDTLLKMPAREIHVGERHGAAQPAVRTLQGRFTKPYLAHAAMGPSCAVAHMQQGKLTIWTHAQGVFPLRGGLAEMLGMKPEDIRCIHVPGAGCYGHNAADDAAADAALIARAVPGRPVRVQWMREQEHTWEPFGPAMVTDVKASLDASGHIVDWQYEIWSNSHNQRIDNAGRLIPATFLAQPFTPAPPKPIPMPEGGGDRNSVPLYNFPNFNIQHHFLPDMPVRVSAMRGLGAFMNVFTIESFMDELASAAGADPVEFRLRHLDDPRGRDVVQLASQRFGWDPQRKRQPGRGVGFSFAQYKNLMSYLAIAVELDVTPETGAVRILRVVAAVDCGQIVNPDGVRNQIEGGILQSASWTLYEQVRHDRTGIRSYDWSTYPIMRFSDVPLKVEVHLIDRPGAPFLGAGEASQGPASAALGNAIADATGQRLRNLPLAAGQRLREYAQA
ncbi:molybdopterin cofactor-binding domain-containing protein [Bordetella sp. BOR01]|uniref:xanthine dehydrogenase family protein molybdopterin-binding subunit n=1 Tax=Bordetella sp. BOR01 TaxID=2854779 RepID=UPI001C493D58|nr:molybdopterin cofactor-binding domain-containing protein [Bordetella sp. BOR01]MBV7483253.1 molybdopterin-dependent oxidoreductase [Bordetella sp. BOR01]